MQSKLLLLLLSVIILFYSCSKDNGVVSKSADDNADSVFTPKNSVVFNSKKTYGSLTDVQGNSYKTIVIGKQTWMAENLKVKYFRNGNPIPTTSSDISNEDSPVYQWAYNNSDDSAAIYGRLYTWYAATDSRGICPDGWHLPDTAEWNTLGKYLGGSFAGDKLKETGSKHWLSLNTTASNSSGFTALPGGSRDFNGTFYSLGDYGYWWASTNSTDVFYRTLSYCTSVLSSDYYYSENKRYGFSVRCIKD